MNAPTFALLTALILGAPLASKSVLHAQGSQANPSDVATPEAVVLAAYASINRGPGESFQWDRFRSLFLPTASLIPNVQQRGGQFAVLSTEEFIEWIDGGTTIGGPNDPGFYEEQVSARVEQFGAVAHVFSTYRKRFPAEERILGMGINSFQLVHHQNRWWISSLAWDEERPGLTIPSDYRGGS